MTGGRVPVWNGYLADPFVLRTPDGYVAVGTAPGVGETGRFAAVASPDLVSWHPLRAPLRALPDEAGDEYWAPEIAVRDGRYWMYYSVGHGISGHHIRVAVADASAGPYVDCGVDVTPGELFAIDPHPFQDADGQWYLFFAHDVLDGERPGTHLAVTALPTPVTTSGGILPVLQPSHDRHIYQRARRMYDADYDWHTLEGPFVLRRHGRYWMTFSGGAWTGSGYGVSWAVADAPTGPWTPAPADAPMLLESSEGQLIGPGHNSVVTGPDGGDVLVFHAWNADMTVRQMHIAPVDFSPTGPKLLDGRG
jgi:beta-xylosidase